MDSQFLPYDLALELKEMGFNKMCLTRFGTTSKKLYLATIKPISNEHDDVITGDMIAAPTYQQAIQFLAPMLKNVVGAYRIIIVQATGAYWLQKRVDGENIGISNETNEDCVRQLIKVIKLGEKY